VVLLENSKALIVGLGKTGLACARYLKAQGIPVAITDSRDLPPELETLRNELPDMATFLGGFDASVFESAEQLIVSPGVSVRNPIIQKTLARGVPVIGDIELFAKAVNAPVVAITGSNGKSTVTTMVGQMLSDAGQRVAVGGNLGEPALNLLQPDIDMYVLELSSFQLETTQSLRPEVAVVLNVSADHMDRYIDIDDYCDTKASIYKHAKNCVFNSDDVRVAAMRGEGDKQISFSLEAPDKGGFGLIQKSGQSWLSHGGQPLIAASELRMPGLHNVANVLAALAIGQSLNISMDIMLNCVQKFTGLPHRVQLVKNVAGVRWYNDSKGTNVGASIAALHGFALEPEDQKTVLIAGGDGKGADFEPLGDAVAKGVRSVILFGQDAAVIAQAIGDSTKPVFAENLDEAVSIAAKVAQRGDRVLFSPACASFDMYASYQERGDAFVRLVKEMVE